MNISHKNIVWTWLLCLLVVVAVLFGSLPTAGAAPLVQPTPFKTPTPGADGRIIYIVQKQDTLWSIASISGIPVERLREMNALRQNEAIHEGQRIFLGMGGPGAESPTPLPTSIPPTATSTPVPEKGTAKLCLLLFDDVNGDAIRQEEEVAIAGGALSVASVDGKVSLSGETKGGMDPICYDELEPGEYNISVAIPAGYNPTTLTYYRIELKAGDETYIDFGAQTQAVATALPFVEPQTNTPTGDEGGVIPILGVLGAFFLLLGVGMAIYAVRLRR